MNIAVTTVCNEYTNKYSVNMQATRFTRHQATGV